MIRIVLTGPPCSGKSTVIERLRESQSQNLCLVPEIASLILAGGFPAPRPGREAEVREFQRAIPPLQRCFETMLALQNPSADCMICDRATLDGAGYWPEGETAFLQTLGLRLEDELTYYRWVVFMRMAGREDYGRGNPFRFHSFTDAERIGKKQKDIWSRHPQFLEIPAFHGLEQKISVAVEAITRIREGADWESLNRWLGTMSRDE